MEIKADRLYIVSGVIRKKGVAPKTHLAYFNPGPSWGEWLRQLCRPDIEIEALVSPCDKEGVPVGRELAADWDTYYNEVTCQTCLKRARGEG